MATNSERIEDLEYMMLAVMNNLGVLIDKYFEASEVSDEAFAKGLEPMREMLYDLADKLGNSNARLK